MPRVTDTPFLGEHLFAGISDAEMRVAEVISVLRGATIFMADTFVPTGFGPNMAHGLKPLGPNATKADALG